MFNRKNLSSDDYSDVKIKQRHALLASTIGTKAEEEISYIHSHNLVIGATVSMMALCALEIVAYFLFNRKVSIEYLDELR